MIKKTLTSLVLAATLAFSGCTKNLYNFKYGEKEKVCNFRLGKELSFATSYTGDSLMLSSGMEDHKKKSSWKLGVGHNFSQLDFPGVSFSKERSSVMVAPNKLVLGQDGMFIDFFQQRFGTSIFSVGKGGLQFIPLEFLPLYVASKLPELYGIANLAAANGRNQQVDTAAELMMTNILFRDALPLLPLKNLFSDIKRVTGIKSEVSGENLEEVLAQMSSPFDNVSEKLNKVESSMNHYSLLAGQFMSLYDSLMLNQSFLFFKKNLKDFRDVDEIVGHRVRFSGEKLEDLIDHQKPLTQDYWSNISRLVHFSGLLDNDLESIDNFDNSKCEINLTGNYLFLADEKKNEGIYRNLLKVAEQYYSTWNEEITTKNTKFLIKALKDLDKGDYSSFKHNYESFFYGSYYQARLVHNFSTEKLELIHSYLGSRNQLKLAKSFADLAKLKPLNNPKYLVAVSSLSLIYDLVKKEEFPTHVLCEKYSRLENNNFLDLKSWVVKFDSLEKLTNRLNLLKSDQPKDKFELNLSVKVYEQARKLLANHLDKYSGEFAHYWLETQKDYQGAASNFWSKLSHVSQWHKIPYDMEKVSEARKVVNYQKMNTFFNSFLENKKVQRLMREDFSLGQHIFGMQLDLGRMKESLTYAKKMQALGLTFPKNKCTGNEYGF